MKRGISPIVAVVLLIAIAVIAAVGLYFWMGGVTTKQTTSQIPIPLSARVLDESAGTIAVANLGSSSWQGSYLESSDGTRCEFGDAITLHPGKQAVCTLPPKAGTTVIFGDGTGMAYIEMGGARIGEVTMQSTGTFGSLGSTITTFTGGTFTGTEEGSIRLAGLNPTFTSDWPMFGYDAANSWKTNAPGPRGNRPLWSYTTGGEVYSSAAVVGGIVYIGSNDGKVYALDAEHGYLIWNFTADGPVYSSPVVVDGVVYIGSCGRYLYALNASAEAMPDVQRELWKWDVGMANGCVLGSPTVYDGKVYFGDLMGNVTTLDLGGNYVWNYTTGNYIYGKPALHNGVAYIGSDNTYVYALNATNGSWIWEYKTYGAVQSSPTIHGGVVYVGSDDNHLHAINATNGIGLWTYGADASVKSSPAVYDEMVYFGTVGGSGGGSGFEQTTYAVNATDGNYLYSYSGITYSSPAIDGGGTVFMGDSSGANAFLPNLGLNWNYNLGSEVWSAPAIAGGVAYIGALNNKVYAIGGYMSQGDYISAPIDSGMNGTVWDYLNWESVLPAGTSIVMYAVAYDAEPDWFNWQPIAEGGSPGTGRYVRYRAELASANARATPEITSVKVGYHNPSLPLTYTVNRKEGLESVALNRTCAGGFDIASTAGFDAGTKGEYVPVFMHPGVNYMVETNTDSHHVPRNAMMLGSRYGDRFTFDKADGLTWKWDHVGSSDSASTSISGGRMRIIAQGDTGQDSWRQLLSNLTGDFDIQVVFEIDSLFSNDYWYEFGAYSTERGMTYANLGFWGDGVNNFLYPRACVDWDCTYPEIAITGTRFGLRIARIGSEIYTYYDEGLTGKWTLAALHKDSYGFADNVMVGMYAGEYAAGATTDVSFSEFRVNSGTLTPGAYFTDGLWLSGIQTVPRYQSLASTTLEYLGVNANQYIERLDWYTFDGANYHLVAEYDTPITSGTSKTITAPTAGSFDNVVGDFAVRVTLAGDGNGSPAVKRVSGKYTGVTETLHNEPASGVFYSNTVAGLEGNCSYTVWGPGIATFSYP